MFQNRTNSPKIDTAIKYVEKLLLGEPLESQFYLSINRKSDWSYTKDEPAKIARVLWEEARQAVDIEIIPYKTRWPFSKVIGYSDGTALYINMRKINTLRTVDYVGNLVHEFCHHAGYQHGNNSPTGKQNSVPYWCGSLAEELFAKILL